MTSEITLPKFVKPFFENYRYCVLWGGRGSGKSFAVADCLILKAYEKERVILCGRAIQDSLADSVHSLLCKRIKALGLVDKFRITRDKITCVNGSTILFKGLNTNISSIRSMTDVNILWIEEADDLTKASWEIIKPTIRGGENAQIWITINPKFETDCIYQTFIATERKGAYVKQLNWYDNPHFPNVLNEERLDLLENDPGLYNHIWEGGLLKHSKAQVFNNYWHAENFDRTVVKEIAYYGMDFGTIDPTAVIRCVIRGNILYITHEFGGQHIDVDEIGSNCEKFIPNFKKSKIYADSSRPDTINLLKKQGYLVEGAQKGKGSVEDGIAFIKTFDRVVIHNECRETIKEFMLYSYKIDARSGIITDDIIDKHNHYIDALRYALSPISKSKVFDYDALGKLY